MASIGQLFDDIKASIGAVAGGTAQPTQQQVPGAGGPLPQGQQGQQAPPPTATNAGVAQAGGAQPPPQNPLLAQLTQPPSNLDTALKYIMPLIAGFAGDVSTGRQAGPWTHIGNALSAGSQTFLQMRQQDAQNQLAKAQLVNTMQHQAVEEQQGQQKINVEKQTADFTTKGIGGDITTALRKNNPDLDKSLPSPEFMAKLPMAEQGKFLQSAVTLADTKAKLAETHQQHEASNDLKSQAIINAAQAHSDMAGLRQEAIANQLSESQNRMAMLQQQIDDKKAAGADAKDLKQQQLAIQKEMADLKKQGLEAKSDNDNANRLVKARQNYDAHWHLTTNWEDYAKSVGVDPDTGATTKGGSSKTTTTIDLP